jgi:hypothetical protein
MWDVSEQPPGMSVNLSVSGVMSQNAVHSAHLFSIVKTLNFTTFRACGSCAITQFGAERSVVVVVVVVVIELSSLWPHQFFS